MNNAMVFLKIFKPGLGSKKQLIVFSLFMLAFSIQICEAGTAYVHFKGKSNALYITNFKFQYALMPGPIEETIVVLPEQTKYEKFPMHEVRRIEFLEVMGEKKMSPVYRVRLHLRKPGHWREVWLMPLKELQGTCFGKPWTYPVDFDRGYEDNAHALKEIHMLPPRP